MQNLLVQWCTFDRVVRVLGSLAGTLRLNVVDAKAARAITALRAGHGAVVEIGGEPVAISRNTAGELQARSAVCPHLRVTVEFDSRAQVWRCPRHGATFAPDGSLIDGKRIVDQPLAPCPRVSRLLECDTERPADVGFDQARQVS